MKIPRDIEAAKLLPKIERLWELSWPKILSIEKDFAPGGPSPVFTVEGRYVPRGWTEWTRGFQYGSSLLQFDATGEESFLDAGRRMTVEVMAKHVTHRGVHDHGFNNVSTYGNLLRLAREGRIGSKPWERRFYELALRASGAVQASRWSRTADGGGYIYSFNGPHSLFADTIRSLRSLALAHALGHELIEENDEAVSLLERLVKHARATLTYNVYYGEGRDAYDVPGRVAHESIFNASDGLYRCPASQQGYSPFTTWMRGLAWVILGCAEQLEFLATVGDGELGPLGGRASIEGMLTRAARATSDFYIENTPADGVPYWDSGAPGLGALGDYLSRPADPMNDREPVDSSAGAIAAQGLLRLGRHLKNLGQIEDGGRYWRAGLGCLEALLGEPYLCADPSHQGLILHSTYHRPNAWDHVPAGSRIPRGEASMWGDYHAREAALYVGRVARGEQYPAFFGPS